jgi:hypothetical protein
MRVEKAFIFAKFSSCSEVGQSPNIDAKNGYNTKADDVIPRSYQFQGLSGDGVHISAMCPVRISKRS